MPYFVEIGNMTKTVFIVHDSASLRRIVGSVLKEAGYDVLEAADSSEALSKLDGRKIHLVIIDLHMPHVDGIALVMAVKQRPAYKFIPVIMLAVESEDEKKADGQALGVNVWVTKPFQPQQILMEVAKLITP